jgi:hypothetical protein
MRRDIKELKQKRTTEDIREKNINKNINTLILSLY